MVGRLEEVVAGVRDREQDHKHHQRLRCQRFDEPPGLEECGIAPGIENIEHHEIRRVIEDRADRTDEQHEFRDVADVPAPRDGQVFGIDIVGRNTRKRVSNRMRVSCSRSRASK